MTIEDQLRTFIVDELNWQGDRAELTDDFPLVERRVIDSLGIMHLLSFLEDRYGVAIGDDEFLPENFESIGRIAGFVEAKRAEHPA
jgi:acyl carrier protein